MRITLRLFLIVACAFIQSAAALAGNGETDGASLNVDASHLKINRVYSYSIQSYAGITDQDCVNLANLSPMPLTWIRLGFALVDSTGATQSNIKVLSDGTPAKAGTSVLYCLPDGYPARTRDAHLVAFITFARFADGSTWQLAPVVPGTSPASSSDPLQVTEVGVYLPSLECATIKNASDKTIRRVRIAFRNRAQDGSTLADYTIGVTVELRPGESSGGNCQDIDLSSTPGVGQYVTSLASGAADPPKPRILFRGKPLSVSVAVTEVDFTDGTSWRASP